MSVEADNVQMSRREIAAIRADKPARIFGYATTIKTGAPITTWTGEEYGRITAVRDPFRSNFGDQRQSFVCRIFGTEYFGMSYPDSGDYVRLRKATR